MTSGQTLRVCPEGGPVATLRERGPSGPDHALMQPRPLQQPGAVGRGQRYVEGDAVMVDGERHVDTCRPERPEFAVEAALTGDLLALHRQDDVASLEFGACRGALGGDAYHH